MGMRTNNGRTPSFASATDKAQASVAFCCQQRSPLDQVHSSGLKPSTANVLHLQGLKFMVLATSKQYEESLLLWHEVRSASYTYRISWVSNQSVVVL